MNCSNSFLQSLVKNYFPEIQELEKYNGFTLKYFP